MNKRICICILFSMKKCTQKMCAISFSCADFFIRAMNALKIHGFSRHVSAHDGIVFFTWVYTYSIIILGNEYCSHFLYFNL